MDHSKDSNRPDSGDQAEVPRAALQELTRDHILPTWEQHRKAGLPNTWEVKIILLPSALWTTRPEKGSDQYLRLKSRKLIVTKIIGGRDAATIEHAISTQFAEVLRSEQWMPLQTLWDPINCEVRLSSSAALSGSHNIDFDFLADHCLMRTEKEKLYLFIAPKTSKLSWQFIRRLPRARLPISSSVKEDFWNSDLDEAGSSEDDGDDYIRSQSESPKYRSNNGLGIQLRVIPQEFRTSLATLLTASESTSLERSTTSAEGENPQERKATSQDRTIRSPKGKYPCPYSDCARSRIPFSYEEYVIEHVRGRHKDPNYGIRAVGKFTDSDLGRDTEHIVSEESVATITRTESTGCTYPEPTSTRDRTREFSTYDRCENSTPRSTGADEIAQAIGAIYSTYPKPASLANVHSRMDDSSRASQPEHDPPVHTASKDATISLEDTSVEPLQSSPSRNGYPETLSDKIDDTSVDAITGKGTDGTSTKSQQTNQILHGNLAIRTRTSTHAASGCQANRPSNGNAATSNGKHPANKRRRTESGRDHPNDNGDEESESDPPKEPKGLDSSDANEPKIFACPFYKRDPRTYRLCVSKSWTKVHRVKEHLKRKHMLPPHQCRRCFQRFEQQSQLDEHVQGTPCARAVEPEASVGVTVEQMTELLKKKKNLKEVDRWNEMYQILFPADSADEIPSPWQSPSHPLDVEEYRTYLRQASPMSHQECMRRSFSDIIATCRDNAAISQEELVAKLVDSARQQQLQSLERFLELKLAKRKSVDLEQGSCGQAESSAVQTDSCLSPDPPAQWWSQLFGSELDRGYEEDSFDFHQYTYSETPVDHSGVPAGSTLTDHLLPPF
ncbi:hypothetical protein JX266_002840 [Neoarthrinium moseri]|nr:hypothetical protein JX266_002840 [Neoarthrinium moseri]